jgi:hypothetical protein
MTQYNSVSGVRFGLQVATAALFYTAARHKKVDGLNSVASRIGIAAVLQGVSQKLHTPLGERSKMNWIADGISLGLVAYGMSYTDLAKRTKYLVGGAVFGSQLVISNLQPQTALARIARIETEEDFREFYAELNQIFIDHFGHISSEEGIQVCKVFFLKAAPLFERAFSGSPADQILPHYAKFLDRLEGWGKVKAQMEYIEALNLGVVLNKRFLERTLFPTNLEGSEKEQFDHWMEKTGTPIHLRWTMWYMTPEEHQAVLERTTEYLRGIGDKITFAQKMDLCEQFFKKSIGHYSSKDFGGSPPNLVLYLREEVMKTLEGMEKAKAYMDYVEFLDGTVVSHKKVFGTIQDIRETLDEDGQAAVDAWMDEKGTAIQEKWSKVS